jgi:hypothetical protein
MQTCGKTTLILFLAILLLSASAFAGKKRDVTETFENIERITLNTVSGDCIVNKGEGNEVILEVTNSYRPRDSFKPRIKARGKTLRLSERILESNSGNSRWIMTVPDGIEIDFSTASGDLTINDLEGIFSAATASGDIEIKNCSGEFEFSTASGDMAVENCHGEFQLSTASGTIDGFDVVIDSESSFTTASGRVDITLAKSAEYDLNVSNASGSAVLDYGGNPITGTFEFEAKVRNGRIVCPIDFDNEETFRRYDSKYVRKTFTRGSDTPLIYIGTATGKAVLKEG